MESVQRYLKASTHQDIRGPTVVQTWRTLVVSRLTQRRGLFFVAFTIAAFLCDNRPISDAQEQRTKIRISNAALNFTSLPLLAAKEWKIFDANGFDVEIIVMSSIVAAPALLRGDIDYVSGVGPASISATLSGLPSKAVWMSSSKTLYWLMTNQKYKNIAELKGKKIGVTGLGGTPHVAFSMALDKLGAPSKDFAMVSLPGNRLLESLQQGVIDAAVLAPPLMFEARKKGFSRLIDIGSLVEMPAGGLTTLVETIQKRPVEVKRVARSLQLAKEEIRKSKNKTVELIVRVLKMERETASDTYDAFITTLSPTGIPSREGMDNLIKAVQSQGRFADRTIRFDVVADDRLATEVAKEMGLKVD